MNPLKQTLRVFLCNRGGVARGWLSGKESTCNARDIGDVDSTLGLGRSPGVGNVNPLQYSCLENPMDRGDWWATAHGSQRVRHEWSDWTCMPGEGHTRTQKSIEKEVSWCFWSPVLALQASSYSILMFCCLTDKDTLLSHVHGFSQGHRNSRRQSHDLNSSLNNSQIHTFKHQIGFLSISASLRCSISPASALTDISQKYLHFSDELLKRENLL